MGKRQRLDLLLLERHLVESREDGRRRILAGEVLVNDQAVTKAGSFVELGARIHLKSVPRYVSRGGFKLEKALQEFTISVKGKTALDIGASTGGFTDCLLAHGAARVFAVHSELRELGIEEYQAVWNLVPASSRAAIKTYIDKAKKLAA